ncbi:MAG: AAA family ATPase [Burkholderiales bacterium]|nr:AAA family ATPase [Burkholderiales bacterium]
MAIVRFHQALQLAVSALADAVLPMEPAVRIIRDLHGRLRFAVDCDAADYPPQARAHLETAQAALGAYATSGEVLFRDSFNFPNKVFGSEDWHLTTVSLGLNEQAESEGEVTVPVLDRQVTGQDWLRPATSRVVGRAPRVAFFGLKGGVGRSTALAMLAYWLARAGKHVLLIDFDLESPGLSGLLLPSERVAGFGLVDWFVEDAVGQGESVLSDLISVSPLAEHLPGSIRVAAAMGQGETDYLSKLARVYAEQPAVGGPRSFAERMAEVLEALEQREQPDVVLIDSRAGLHDLAAVSITHLADLTFLFANDSEQSWMGYQQLFAHWRQRPEVARRVRGRLAIVRALFPELDQERRAKAFTQRAFDLFSELYDRVEPGQPPRSDLFSFDLDDEDAPHSPLTIRWNARFQEFEPWRARSNGTMTDADIELAFGPFFDKAMAILAESRE